MTFSLKKTLCLASLLGLATIGTASAQTPLVINFDEGNAPFMYSEGGKPKGIYPSLISAAFAKMGTNVQLNAIPWKRALAEADEGKAGVGGIYKNSARLEKYDFSEAIYQEKLVLYTLKDKTFPFAKLDDLKGKSIAVVRGWSYGDAFDKARADKLFKAEETENDQLNLKKLAAGRVEAVVASPAAADPILKKEGLTDKVVALSEPVTTNDTYLIFPKAMNKADLLKTFNETLQKMKADGSYEAAAQDK